MRDVTSDPGDSRQRLAAELLASLRADRTAQLLRRPSDAEAKKPSKPDAPPPGEVAIAGHQKRDNRRFSYPVLRVMVGKAAYDTIDWSLGGLMCKDYVGDLKKGARTPLVISDPGRSGTYFSATARVIRIDTKKRTIALQFLSLSAGGFEWLSGLQLAQTRRR